MTKIRKVTIFQTDDGRRVDMVETVGETTKSDMDRATISSHMGISTIITPNLDVSYEGVDVLLIGGKHTVVKFDLIADSVQGAFEIYDARIAGIIEDYNQEVTKKAAPVIIDANQPIDPKALS